MFAITENHRDFSFLRSQILNFIDCSNTGNSVFVANQCAKGVRSRVLLKLKQYINRAKHRNIMPDTVLNDGILAKISQHMDLKTAAKARSVSKSWNERIKDDKQSKDDGIMSNIILNDDIVRTMTQYMDLGTASVLRMVSRGWNEMIRESKLDLLETYASEHQKLLGAKRHGELVQSFQFERTIWTDEYTKAMRTNITKQSEVNMDTYRINTIWLREVHFRRGLSESCLHLTIQIINRYLALNNVPLNEFQTLGAAATMISCFYTKNTRICIHTHARNNYTTAEKILNIHHKILDQLDFVPYPTPSDYLQRFLRAANFKINDKRDFVIKNNRALVKPFEIYSAPYAIALYFIDVLSIDETLYHIRPSLAAAAAVMCTLRVLGSHGWTRRLEYYTTYSFDDVNTIADKLVMGSCTLNDVEVLLSTSWPYLMLEGIDVKYSSERYARVMDTLILFN